MQGKTVTNKDLEKILMQVSIKSALMDKLGIPLDRADFEAKLREEIPEKTANISDMIKNLCDFGLISKNMSEKLVEKYAGNDVQKVDENVAVSDFAGLEGNIRDYFEQNLDLKNLIDNSDMAYDAKSLEEIYKLAKTLEARAIEGYKKELEKMKKSEIKAPQSLANSSGVGGFVPSAQINKKDIAKMSTDEFLRNEEIINKLMRQKRL